MSCRHRVSPRARGTRLSGAALPTAVWPPGQPVRAANAYIFRYWLGGHFYYVSTNYALDPVCILHLPGAAKDRQLKLIYRIYARRGAFPPPERIHRLCGLPAAHPPLLRTVWTRLLARL